MEAAEEAPQNGWLQYRLAWVANRLELPEEALGPALAAWDMQPSNEWYMAEYLKTLGKLGMYSEILETGGSVRGGGTCRYYLAVAERELGISPSPSAGYFFDACSSSDDSTAADAMVWTVILMRESLSPDSVISLLGAAVEAAPSSSFYRSLLVETLAAEGLTEQAGEHLVVLRLEGRTDQGYWAACAELAEAENDPERRIWALERAMEARDCPASRRELGWALYLAGRDAVRDGDAPAGSILLERAVALGCPEEEFHFRADSLGRLLDEFEESAHTGR